MLKTIETMWHPYDEAMAETWDEIGNKPLFKKEAQKSST